MELLSMSYYEQEFTMMKFVKKIANVTYFNKHC